jgi:hypothetical protein
MEHPEGLFIFRGIEADVPYVRGRPYVGSVLDQTHPRRRGVVPVTRPGTPNSLSA